LRRRARAQNSGRLAGDHHDLFDVLREADALLAAA